MLSAVVNKTINRIPSATLIYADGDVSKQTFDLSSKDAFEPGKKIEIKVGYEGKEESIFKGVVVKHGIKVKGGSSMLVVECRDEAMKMTISPKNKYYADTKDSDAIETVIGNHGVQKEVEATSVTHKEIVQYYATDWDFMMCRAEMNGMLCIVNDGKITVGKPKFSGESVLKITYGATIYDLDAEIDARFQYKAVKATAWNPADQKLVDGIEGQKSKPPKAGNLDSDQLAEVGGEDDFSLQHGGNLKDQELQQWANSMMLKHSLAMIRGNVRTDGFAKIKPGDLIELIDVGDRFKGKLYVTGVRHEIGDGDWRTVTQFGVEPEWFSQSYKVEQPLSGGLLPAITGLHVGVVTDLEDPDGEDRIRVRMPVISPSDDGIWSRIATLDAGKERGTFFRPEINDEVIVGFLDNDPRHAIVLGMCNSSNKPAPLKAENANNEKGYVSRSKMKMIYNDDKKTITIETPAGNKVLISDDEKKIYMEDQNGNKFTMDKDGVKIESVKDIVMTAKKDIKAEASSNVNIKASAQTKVEGSSGAEFSSGGNTVVKGSMVKIN
jgi:Rhs element Vgr protein